MNLAFLDKIFPNRKKRNLSSDSIDNTESVNGDLNNNSIETNISMECNKDLIKIEIKKNCNLKEYCYEKDMRLQEIISNIDNNMIDMIKQIPMRMLISSGINTIYKQTIYLFSIDECEYIISLNTENIHISESRVVNKEIEESSIQINYKNRKYEISKFVHDLNKSTKNVRSYIPGMNSQVESFNMDKEEAILTAKTLLQHLEKIELIRDVLDLQYIKSLLNFDELSFTVKTSANTELSNEKNNQQLEY